MTSEVEITLRVMTPRKGQDPYCTAEKVILEGDLTNPEFMNYLLRDTHVLISRATNSLIEYVLIPKAQAAAAEAREKDADFEANF